MMKIINTSFSFFIVLICCFVISAQSVSQEPLERKVFNKGERPQLSVDYSKVGRFKLATRKNVYHVGEMINVVGAIINTSAQDVFLIQLDPQFQLFDAQGQQLKIKSYFNIDKLVSENSFDLIGQNNVTVKSFELLAGCDNRAEEILKMKNADDADDRQIFEKGLFGAYLGSCLQIKQPGIYKIKARQENQLVVDSGKELAAKTATGTIESESITIKIIK